jgi:hypothetical protein
MPNGTEGAPDELDSLTQELETSAAPEDITSSETAGLPDALKPSNHGAAAGQQRQQAILGKYRTTEELAKAHKSLRSEFDKRSQKLNTLNEIIQNPKFNEWAAKDPQIREALVKAGYELALERQEQQREQDGGFEWDDNDPRCQVALLRAEMEYDRQLSAFQRKLGRDMSAEERQAIFTQLQAAPSLTVEQAYKLTSHFEKSLKAAEEKRFAEATRKANPNRPKPPIPMAPGQKIDLKKPVTDFNDAEKRQYISDLLAGGNS